MFQVVSNCRDAGQPQCVGVAVWQGIFFSLLSGIVVACLSFVSEPIFRWVGHAPEIQRLEAEYFAIVCWAAPMSIASNALSGFFAGRGATRTLMIVHVSGFALSIGLDYVLIFGKLGFPEMGMAGAAWANLLGQGCIALLLGILFLLPRFEHDFRTWSGCRWDAELFMRLVRFGVPNGARFAFELLAWNSFLIFVGRLGKTENAVTNIVWALNGFAFFPVIGLSEAVRALVGQAQGRGDPGTVKRCVWRGLLIGEIWMIAWASIYLLFPGFLLGLFKGQGSFTAEDFAQVALAGTILLRFVAFYCLLDAANILIMGALQGVGDTVWTFCAALVMNASFLTALWWVDRVRPEWAEHSWTTMQFLYLEWSMATAFVMLMALVWMARFASGRWKDLRVIETGPPALSPPAPAAETAAS